MSTQNAVRWPVALEGFPRTIGLFQWVILAMGFAMYEIVGWPWGAVCELIGASYDLALGTNQKKQVAKRVIRRLASLLVLVILLGLAAANSSSPNLAGWLGLAGWLLGLWLYIRTCRLARGKFLAI